GGQSCSFGNISICKSPADLFAGFRVAHRLEETTTDDFERFLCRDRLPKRLNAAECFFEGSQRCNAALTSGLNIRLGERCQYDGIGHEFYCLGERLHEGEIAVVAS